MVMPGMNGCDLLEYFTEKKIRMNVIVVTAYDTPSARACAVKYGAIAFLRKPVDGNSLLDMVKYKYNKPD
jgi:FixJ family two-component response regulator